jgi:rubredoxin
VELVTIRTFDNYFLANILMSKLRDGGIQCYLKDEHTVTVDPFLSNAVGIKLVINKDDEQEVIQLLQKFDEDYRRNAVCPKCGSHNIELVPKRTAANMITAILSWVFSDYAVSAENVYKCSVCGYESKTLPEPLQKDASLLETKNMN